METIIYNGTINFIGTNFLTEPTITKFDSILDWDNFNHFYNIFHLNWDKNILAHPRLTNLK